LARFLEFLKVCMKSYLAAQILSCVSTRSQGTRLRQSSVGSDVPMVVVVRKAQRPNQLLHANRRRAS
jgi:hypothetical protein